MDARQLYVAQVADEPDAPYDLRARDAYVSSCVAQQAARSSAPLRVVELSVGDGRLSGALAAVPRVGKLVCADISRGRLDAASRRTASATIDVECVECNFDTDLERLPTSAFDTVVALDILEHVFDVFGFLQHCQRILAGGGSLLLRVPNIAYVRHRVRLLRGELPITASWFGPADDFGAWRRSWGWDGGHLHLFTIPALKQLLAESGFEVVSCRDAGARHEAVRDWWPNLLYSNPVFVARRS
jgi:cyclopropane fatty-acyl-phospholipid synthase-like methyltransferase